MSEPNDALLTGRIETATFLAGYIVYRVAVAGAPVMQVREIDAGQAGRAIGASVGLIWTAADVVVLES